MVFSVRETIKSVTFKNLENEIFNDKAPSEPFIHFSNF